MLRLFEYSAWGEFFGISEYFILNICFIYFHYIYNYHVSLYTEYIFGNVEKTISVDA